MKNVYPIIIVVFALILGFFVEFPSWLYIGLIVLFFVALLMAELSVLYHNVTGDFQMKSQTKVISIYDLFMGLLFLGLFFLNIVEDNTKENITSLDFIYFIWIFIFLVEVIAYFVYKKKQPVTLVIDNDTLILLGRFVYKRNLKNVNSLDFTTMGSLLKLSFVKKLDLTIAFKEYNAVEFRRFLEILVEKSEHDLQLTEEMKKLFPTSSQGEAS